MSTTKHKRRSLSEDDDEVEVTFHHHATHPFSTTTHDLVLHQDHSGEAQRIESARRFLWRDQDDDDDDDDDEGSNTRAVTPASHVFLTENPPTIHDPTDGTGAPAFGHDIDLDDDYVYSFRHDGTTESRGPRGSNPIAIMRLSTTRPMMSVAADDDLKFSDETIFRVSDEYGKRIPSRGHTAFAFRNFLRMLGRCELCLEELCFKNTSSGRHVMRKCCCLSMLLVVAAVIILLAISPHSPTPDHEYDEQATNRSINDLKTVLLSSPYHLSKDHLDDPTTPEGKALDWLTNIDTVVRDSKTDVSSTLVQRYALVTFFLTTEGNSISSDGMPISIWTKSTNWLSSSSSVCTWYGVECIDSQVIKLNLTGNNVIMGDIPTVLGALSTMVTLDLSANAILGSIPQTMIELLSNLRILDLGDNRFHGQLPDLSILTLLRGLNVGKNGFTGFTNPYFSGLTSLTMMGLYENSFRTALADIYFPQNLEMLLLQKSETRGFIPDSIYTMSSLTELHLGMNRLSGTISKQLENLSHLVILKLNDNNLKGSLPNVFDSLAKLEELSLVKNKLAEPLPPSIGSLTKLKKLLLAENQFSGTLPLSNQMTSLSEMYLASNMFYGPLPDLFGFMPNLTLLKVEMNDFTGEIPSSIGNCDLLMEITLDDNSFVGQVPTELGRLSMLKSMTMENTLITGTIPSALCSLVDEGSLQYLAADCKEEGGVECSCCHRCA